MRSLRFFAVYAAQNDGGVILGSNGACAVLTLGMTVVAMLFAVTAAAQLHESVTVSLVEVPVTVIDAAGNPVRGLTAANFELFDQGKKREITSFDTIDFAVHDAAGAISPMNPNARRSFLLLFDLGYSTPGSLVRAEEAARRFVKESVQPRDLVGVGTIDVDRGFHLLAAFTTDRELVAAAIGSPRDFVGTDPLQIANQRVTFAYNELPEEPDAPAPAPADGGRGAAARANREAAHEHQQDVSEAMKREGSGAVRKRIEKEVDALGDLARMLRAVPGRKQVILLSEGFDASFLQGRNARADAADLKTENDQVIAGQVWKVDSDARYGSVSGLSTLDRMAAAFRSSDVVLHAIDIKGVRVQNDVAEGAINNSNAGLFTLSRPTGGLVFENTNNLKDNFARMLRAQEVVYVLGFQAPPAKPGSFHELNVKVAGATAARVSHRAGYFEPGTESSPAAPRSLSDAQIIVDDIPQRGVRVDALAAPFPIDEARGQVAMVVEINGADLLRTTKDGNALAEVYVYAFDRDGMVRDRLFETMRLDLARAEERLRGNGAKWLAMLTLPPGDYAIKTLVRIPETDRRGFVRTAVRVPRAGEVAAMPFFVEEQPRRWVTVRGTTMDPNSFPFQFGTEALMPSAAPALRKGETRRFAVFVAGTRVDDVRVDAAFVGASGDAPQIIGEGQVGGLAKLLFACDAAALAPGPAALRIVVHRDGMNDLKTTLPLVVSE